MIAECCIDCLLSFQELKCLSLLQERQEIVDISIKQEEQVVALTLSLEETEQKNNK